MAGGTAASAREPRDSTVPRRRDADAAAALIQNWRRCLGGDMNDQAVVLIQAVNSTPIGIALLFPVSICLIIGGASSRRITATAQHFSDGCLLTQSCASLV